MKLGTNLKKLAGLGGASINPSNPSRDTDTTHSQPALEELWTLLETKNGFYAFESSLHVFPSKSFKDEIGLVFWNSKDLWKAYYNGFDVDAVFFAEDAFGGQFCVKHDGVYAFEPETGEAEFIAESIDDWAKEILSDYELLTGYKLAHEWQQVNGAIPIGRRLLPKIPFVTGGDFSIHNLNAVDSVKGMRLRGELAVQIRDLPDGSKIRFSIID